MSYINKIIPISGTLSLILLMLVYLSNSFTDVSSSAKFIQIFLLGVCCIAALKIKRIDLFTITIFGLSSVMFLASLIGIQSASILNVFSNNFLWFFVYLLGLSITNFPNAKQQVVKIMLIGLVPITVIYTQNMYFEFNVVYKDYVLTSVYYLICMLPFILISENKRLKQLACFIILVYTVISFKRSALIVLLITYFVLYLYEHKVKKIFLKLAILSTVGLLFLAMLGVVNFYYQSDILNLWIDRFLNSDGRTAIYIDVIERQLDATFLEWIIGHGYNAVALSSMSGLSAHCEYIEVLYNYGIIAEGLFILLISLLIIKFKKINKENDRLRKGFLASITIFLLTNIPSHTVTYSTYFLIIAFFWGYTNGIILNKKRMIWRSKNENWNFDIS